MPNSKETKMSAPQKDDTCFDNEFRPRGANKGKVLVTTAYDAQIASKPDPSTVYGDPDRFENPLRRGDGPSYGGEIVRDGEEIVRDNGWVRLRSKL